MQLVLFVPVALLLSLSASQQCNPSGFLCNSCTSYTPCIDDLPEGSPQTCPEGTYCDQESVIECSASAICGVEQVCTEEGRFPSVMSCSEYFTCSYNAVGDTLVKQDHVCPGSSLFNAVTLKCTKADNVVCYEAVAEADTPPTEASPPVDSTTEVETTLSTPTESITSSEPTTSPAESTISSVDPSAPTTSPTELTTVETETTTVVSFVCKAEGVFADTTNCKWYYRCTSSLVQYQYTCPGNTYFNEITSKCSLQLSPSCQAQVGTTTTTTTTKTTPTTTSTTTTTTTPSTTTTTPSTTTTTSPKPFQCVTAGVFPHPTDCRKYYRCTASLTTYEYTCPGNTYFNEVTLKCGQTPSAKCSTRHGLFWDKFFVHSLSFWNPWMNQNIEEESEEDKDEDNDSAEKYKQLFSRYLQF